MDQIIPPQSKPSNKRVTLKHALIDVDFLHTPKIIALRRKFGDIAALAIIEITMQLSKATEATIELDTALAVVEHFRIDNSDEFINYCIDRGILQKTELGFITEKGVIEDQQKLGEQQDKWKEKKRKQRQNEYVPRDMGGDTIGDSPGKSEQLKTEDLKILDPKEGGSGETIDLGHGIKLDPMAMDALKLEFARFDLKPGWIKRAAIYCATQNNEKYKNGPYLYLSTWGLQRCLEEKDKALRIKNTENIGKKYDPGPKRPATMSPAKPDFTGPLNTIEKNLLEIVMPKAKVLTSS